MLFDITIKLRLVNIRCIFTAHRTALYFPVINIIVTIWCRVRPVIRFLVYYPH